ncbi:DNA-binding protein SMUBP-2 [Sesbania bispinosa]|nr:DNA-binding protein SMUBP-2 [Sesbania bispinosa]
MKLGLLASSPQLPSENNVGGGSGMGINHNGDPVGRKKLGKIVVRWIRDSMRAMASDIALAELQGELEFSELRQRMEPGLTFVIQAQPYLNVVPMPLGLEVICLKTCTHYPTLFDHFQRELRDVLQDLQGKSLVQDWRDTQPCKLIWK